VPDGVRSGEEREGHMADESSVATVGVPWWSVLIQGIFAVIIGLMLLGAGDLTSAQGTLLVVQIIGWYWFFTGIMNLVLMFVDHSMWGWKLFSGLVGVLAGVYIIQHPLWSTLLVPLTLVILLGIQGIIIGVIDIVKGFKGGGWGIGLLGVLSILLGLWLLSRPYMAALAVPMVGGLMAIILGIAAIVMSFQVKKLQAA
jgi:uncharacterized membrane protein HdeD (DUF308 family)